MTYPHHAHPAQPDPDPADVVPGTPPVPVNIWRLPADEDTPVGARLAARLLAEYTRPRELVYDHLPSPVLRTAAGAAGRTYRPVSRFQAPTGRAALAVTRWPVAGEQTDPMLVLAGLRRRLRPGGFLAVITSPDPDSGTPPAELGPLVDAATAVGLSYLQHIVTMPTGDHQPPTGSRSLAASAGGPVHERVHGDLLVFSRTGSGDA